MKDFTRGIQKSIPIFLGYFAVSFTFGVFCYYHKIAPLTAIVMSFTNLTSSGQFAGVKLISEYASYIEIALTVLLINIRYVLMSISLSQKIDPTTNTFERLLLGFGITDEIYACIIHEENKVNYKFVFGMIFLPLVGWTLGTALGVLCSNLLPVNVQNAFGIALYAMFIAIFLPDCKKSKPISIVVIIAIIISCLFYYVPVVSTLSIGFKIIITTIIASSVGALFFPIKENNECM